MHHDTRNAPVLTTVVADHVQAKWTQKKLVSAEQPTLGFTSHSVCETDALLTTCAIAYVTCKVFRAVS